MTKVESKTLPLCLAALVTVVAIVSGGCRICADCEDLAYPAYGGAWQRTNRESGRVGSLFDPAGGKAAALVDRDDPSDPDEIQRQRQEERGGLEDPDPSDDDSEMKRGSSDEEAPENQRNKENELRDRELDDIQGDDEEELRKRELDDIEVRFVPGRPPVMVNTE